MLDEGAVRFGGAGQFAEVGRRRASQKGEGARPKQRQRPQHFGRRQPQIERRVNHADFEASVREQDVLGEQGQAGGQVVSLAEAHIEELHGQRRGGRVELAPTQFGACAGVHDGRRFRLPARPKGDDVVHAVAPAEALFVVRERALGHAPVGGEIHLACGPPKDSLHHPKLRRHKPWPSNGRYHGRVERSFYIQNFGCRATQADGAAIQRALGEEGLETAADIESANIVILNSCTVTAAADEDLRQALRRVHRRNPAASILVTGCYAQRRPEDLAGFPGVKWVVGNTHKHRIAEMILKEDGVPYHGLIQVGEIAAEQEFLAAPVDDATGDRTRPNLKIQDGCGNRCTFCVIPSVRGRSRSAPADWVVERGAQALA